jgi:hypothetical protein
MAAQQIFVLGTDGNLWLEQGPFDGVQIPPPRVPVDGSVDLYAAFAAINAEQALVCGSDGNLWLEQGPFGVVPLPGSSYPPHPGSRFQIDGSVAAFEPWSAGEIFVLGGDGNLWLEFNFGSTLPAVPPPRTQIDGSVVEFQPMSLTEIFVLGQDGNLWHELAPFGAVPLPACDGATTGCRSQVDADIRSFMAVDSQHVFVIDSNNDLWLDSGSFAWGQIPPARVHVDGDVAGIWAIDAEEIYVLGNDGNLWRENAPFGAVPLPLCSQTSGFGKGFACRTLIFSNVDAFGVFPDAGGTYVVDGNLDLWSLGTPNVKIDGRVIAFQPLSSAQASLRAKGRASKGPRTPRMVRRAEAGRAGRRRAL